MHRRITRISFILLVLVAAMAVPLIWSGYAELEKASTAGSYTQTAQHYQNAAQRLPWRADLYELSGHAYYYAKEYPQAENAYQKALEHNALSPAGWVAWGDVIYLGGDPERALAIWEQARQRSDPSEQLYPRLAEMYQSRGDFSMAVDALQTYVSVQPDDAGARYRLGLLLSLSDAESASVELERAAQLNPDFAPAVEALRSAIDQASVSASTSAGSVTIGRGLGLIQEWHLAAAAFEAAIEADAINAEAWAWLGEAKQQLDLPEAGFPELERALQLNPDSPAVRGLRGLYFQRTGNFRQALVEFTQAVALDPENPTWYVSLGESHAKTGDLIRALQAYRSATSVAPEDPLYWRLLAIFCAQNNVNVRDVGIAAAQKAIVLAPEEADSLDVLGWLLTLDERYEEAARMLSRALELDPDLASAHLHLGTLFLQTGDRTSAYSHLVRARDLGDSEAQVILNQYFP